MSYRNADQQHTIDEAIKNLEEARLLHAGAEAIYLSALTGFSSIAAALLTIVVIGETIRVLANLPKPKPEACADEYYTSRYEHMKCHPDAVITVDNERITCRCKNHL